MSYETLETSQHDSQPVECYRFIGSFREYRYTSSEDQVTVNGLTYDPIPVKRNAVKAGTQSEDGLALEVELPFDCDVVQDYAYSESPPRLTLELIRAQRGGSLATDWVIEWKGRVTGFSVTGRICKIKVPSIFVQVLQGDVPTNYYQQPCNHVLFDSGCKLSRATYSTTTSVITADVLAVEVTNDAFADGYLAGGEIVNQRTGERRLILNNVVNVVSLNYPFVDMRVGDTVELTAGCDHSWATCKTKFNNGANYGGHPFIPGDNPFDGQIG